MYSPVIIVESPAVNRPSTSFFVQPAVVEGVVRGLGVVLQGGLIGDDADLVRLGDPDDGDSLASWASGRTLGTALDVDLVELVGDDQASGRL